MNNIIVKLYKISLDKTKAQKDLQKNP